MKQPVNSVLVFQATVCDGGVSRKVFQLYESWGGCTFVRHHVQAEKSCGTGDQNPCTTGAILMISGLLILFILYIYFM